MPNNYNCSIFSFGVQKRSFFIPKIGQIVLKVDGLTSSYKIYRPTTKSDISLKEKSELEKGID